MKKKLFLFCVLASLLSTSCLKDGFNDFEALQHPMAFHGTVNPTLGVPIGSGSATIYDMLRMVQISSATMEVNNNGIITIVYDTTSPFHIDMENSKFRSRNSGRKDPSIVHVARNTIEGSVNVDLFNNIHELDSANIEVDSLKVYLNAFVQAQADNDALAAMDSFHVHVYYDQLRIDVVGQNGQLVNVLALPDSIPIDSLIVGQNLVLFNDNDISDAINTRPREIKYSARMNIAFEAAFFANANISENQFVADSIGIKSVDINAHLKVSFPISAYINNLHYSTDIEFSPSYHLNDLVIDSSMIYFDCFNGIPLSFDIQAQFVDANNNVLCDIFNPAVAQVAGADVALDPTSNLYTAINQKQTQIQIPVTQTVFNALLNTAKIRVNAALNTSETNNTLRKRVSIQATDKLDLRVWAKLKPLYNLDIEIGGSSSDTTSSKGGAR